MSQDSVFVAVIVAVAGVAACGGGAGTSGPTGGGGSGAGGGGTSTTARPLCADSPGPSNLPDTFGVSCGAGSNQALCAIDSATQCSGGTCLWDNGNDAAYCTIACAPGNVGSCPANYVCRGQSCSTGPLNVCVRAGTVGQTCATMTATQTDSVADALAGPSEWLYAFGYTSAYENQVYARAPGATAWTKILQRPALAFFAGADGGNILTKDALYYTLGDGTLYRLADGAAAEEKFENCTAPDCNRQPLRYFVTPSGALRAFTSVDGEVLERDGQGGWSLVVTTLPRRLQFLTSFRDSGFLTRCSAPGAVFGDPIDGTCIGSTGDDLQALALPAGEALPEFAEAVLGDSSSDFLIFFQSGVLYHRVAGSWLKEGLPAPTAATTNAGVLTRFPDGTVYAASVDALYRLNGSCWSRVDGEIAPGVPLSGGKVGWPYLTQWCEVPAP